MVERPPPEPVGWRIVVEVHPSDAELVADQLFQGGALGIEEREGAGGRVLLLAGMPDRDAAHDVAATLDGAEVVPIVDDGWADAWRVFARPVVVGAVRVQPAWLPIEASAEGEVSVSIDPGRAFGSGSHETTRLALAALLAHTSRGARVLDVGCGSGVLGITAALVAGAKVVAVDIDEHAVEVTRENAERNGVADRVDASAAPVAELDGRFDVVVANILAVVLRTLAPDFARLLAPGGTVVLAGMLDEQVAAIDDAFGVVGLRGTSMAAEGAWRSRCYKKA